MQTIRTTRPSVALPPSLASVLPQHLCDAIRQKAPSGVEEVRLHSNRYATVTVGGRSLQTGIVLSAAEMSDVLKRMCGGSLYAHGETINKGYLTLAGGIRVGVCGTAAVENGQVIGVGSVSGLIIRVPHAVAISARPVLDRFLSGHRMRGILVYSPPGVGKTTLLRAMTAALASSDYGLRTVAVDTREELCFGLDARELSLDILMGYPRDVGIGIAVRSMGAQVIVCDEIGGMEDAHAILAAANCGVPIIASAHASSAEDLLSRPFMRLLHQARAFECYVGITRGGECGFCYRFTDRRELSKPRAEASWC